LNKSVEARVLVLIGYLQIQHPIFPNFRRGDTPPKVGRARLMAEAETFGGKTRAESSDADSAATIDAKRRRRSASSDAFVGRRVFRRDCLL